VLARGHLHTLEVEQVFLPRLQVIGVQGTHHLFAVDHISGVNGAGPGRGRRRAVLGLRGGQHVLGEHDTRTEGWDRLNELSSAVHGIGFSLIAPALQQSGIINQRRFWIICGPLDGRHQRAVTGGGVQSPVRIGPRGE
jgi:hypothetical protein